jgi:hypothetical protein
MAYRAIVTFLLLEVSLNHAWGMQDTKTSTLLSAKPSTLDKEPFQDVTSADGFLRVDLTVAPWLEQVCADPLETLRNNWVLYGRRYQLW